MKPALRVPIDDLTPGRRTLGRAEAHYVTRVHRLGAGARFVAFDPKSALEADVTIISTANSTGVIVEVGQTRAAALRSEREITWLQGIPKGDKMDAIVRDATELGATRVVAAITERATQPSASRVDRWRRIAVEAARQCGRGDAPEIVGPTALEDIAGIIDSGVFKIVLDPTAVERLAPLLSRAGDGAITILAGPEGGLSARELDILESMRFVRAKLGTFVLRTETACAAALGALAAR